VARRSIHGRVALDRTGVSAHTSAARSTVNHWHRHRRTTGFPDGFAHEGGEWFWLDDIDTFHVAHRAAKLAELTRIDRGGDPDELVGSGEAARIMGYASYRNLPAELYDNPDHDETLSGGRRRRKYWHRRSVWAIADARTGRQSTGRTPGSTTGPRKPHPYADDPRLDTAREVLRAARTDGLDTRGLSTTLTQRLGVPARTAQRLLAAAEHADPQPSDDANAPR
jgi:hypothetical protein